MGDFEFEKKQDTRNFDMERQSVSGDSLYKLDRSYFLSFFFVISVALERIPNDIASILRKRLLILWPYFNVSGWHIVCSFSWRAKCEMCYRTVPYA